jgi:hypothetical protein
VDVKTKAMDYADRMDRKLWERIGQLEKRLEFLEERKQRRKFFRRIKNHLQGVKDD